MKITNPHKYRTKWRKEELELLESHKVKTILEVGKGDENNIRFLSALNYDVNGIDNIFKKFSFKDNSFDCIYSFQYLNHNKLEKIKISFKEMYRVLKKDGLFLLIISDADQFNLKHIKDYIYVEQDPEFPKIRYKKIDEQTYVKLEGDEKGIVHYAFYQDQLKNILQETGFRILKMKKIKWNLVVHALK